MRVRMDQTSQQHRRGHRLDRHVRHAKALLFREGAEVCAMHPLGDDHFRAPREVRDGSWHRHVPEERERLGELSCVVSLVPIVELLKHAQRDAVDDVQ